MVVGSLPVVAPVLSASLFAAFVGVLFVDKHASLEPIIYGGGQESGLRAGTENTPLIVGAGKAIALAQAEYRQVATKTRHLRDQCIADLQVAIV